MAGKAPAFQKVVFGAYTYFLLLFGANVILSGMQGKLNWFAAMFTIVFLAQFYFKHKMTNLITGVILLLTTIYFFLEALMGFKQAAAAKTLESFDYIMLGITGLGIVSSVILIMSFYKLSFHEE